MRYLLLMAALLCTACMSQSKNIVLRGPNEVIPLVVEIADEEDERQKGLMHRTELPDGTGMLFVFEQEQVLRFWMKNTLIPLDILYFDQNGVLVSHATMQPCTEDPCPTYSSQNKAQYALEVPVGFVEEHQIEEGWLLIR